MAWYYDPASGKWVNPGEGPANDPIGTNVSNMLPASAVAASPAAGQAGSPWRWDSATNTFRTNLNTTPAAGGGRGYNMPIGTNRATTEAGYWNNLAGDYSQSYQNVGYEPATAFPGWESTAFSNGTLQRMPTPDGGFTVFHPASGRYIGSFRPADPIGSDWDQFGNWRGTMDLPPQLMQQMGRQPTLSREYQMGQVQNQADQNRISWDTAQLQSGTQRYGYDLQAQTSRYSTDVQAQTAAAARAMDWQIAQLQDSTQRLISERNHQIATGQLELSRVTEARIAANEQKRIGLETRRMELDERVAAANMAANPANWVANEFFQRGLPTPAGTLASGSPGSAGVFAARNAGATAPVGAPAVDNTSASTGNGGIAAGGVDYNNLPFLQAIRDGNQPAFQPQAGPAVSNLGFTVPDPMQVNLGAAARLRPSQLGMLEGAIRATGQDPADYFEVMRRAAPVGRSRDSVMTWG